MPVKVSILSKLNPNQLAPLKKGKAKLDINEPITALESRFMKALQAIATSLDGDLENSAETKLFMLLLEKCTTLDDSKPQSTALLIPPSKEPQFKIKALCKIPEIKKSKQIGICQIIAVGEKEEGLHLFDLYKRGGKLKITPKLLTRLNKMGKKKRLKFRKPVTEENEDQVADTDNNGLLSTVVARLEQAQSNFEAAPSLGVLKIWSNVMMKLKQEIQLLAKKAPDQLETAKNIFNEWNQKLAAAKKQLRGGKPAPKTEDINAKLDALNLKKDQVAVNPTIDAVIGLLAECQKLRTSPVSKSAFKKDAKALNKFKVLRKAVASLLEGDLKTTLETNLTDPSIVKTEMKNKISAVWNSFISNAESALRFEIIADTLTPNLLTDIKAFQKTISEKAQGLIEASKLMNLGDTVKISENMTAVRSALSKLKQHMEAKYEEIKEVTQKMAKLEKACYATDSKEEKTKIIEELETLANSIEWEQTWDSFSYA